MPLATDVKLPKSHVPVFPHRCIRCGREPTTVYRATTRAIGWWTALFAAGGRHEAEVPACQRCVRALRSQRWVRLGVTIAFLAVGVWLGTRIVGGTGGARKWLVGGIALLAAVPAFVWHVVAPPPFDMTAYSDTVDYEFADPDYADEFADLNS